MTNKNIEEQTKDTPRLYTEEEHKNILELQKEEIKAQLREGIIQEEIEKGLAKEKKKFEDEKKQWREDAIVSLSKKANEIADEKAIVIADKYKELSPKMREFEENKKMVEFYVEGKALPLDMTAARLMMTKEFGETLGLTFMESISGIAFISGKPMIHSSVYLSLLKRAGYTIEVIRSDDEEAEIKLKNKDGDEMTGKFTAEQAKSAGLLTKDIWVKWRKRMLFYKAVREAQIILCPEVLGGAFLSEESVEFEDNKENSKTISEGQKNNNFENYKEKILKAESENRLREIFIEIQRLRKKNTNFITKEQFEELNKIKDEINKKFEGENIVEGEVEILEEQQEGNK